METKGVDVPKFIVDGDYSIVEFNPIICCWRIVPSPIAVHPIVEILSIQKSIEFKNGLKREVKKKMNLRDCGSIA
jgi:hypothetical protein